MASITSSGMARRYYRAVGTNSNANTHALAGMVWIQPGIFTMGSPTSEADRNPGEDQPMVTISQGFWMSKCETTKRRPGPRLTGYLTSKAIALIVSA